MMQSEAQTVQVKFDNRTTRTPEPMQGLQNSIIMWSRSVGTAEDPGNSPSTHYNRDSPLKPKTCHVNVWKKSEHFEVKDFSV